MSKSLGYAVLPVVPSTKGFKKSLDKDVIAVIDSSGKKASSRLSTHFKSAFEQMEKDAQKAATAQENAIKKVEKAEDSLQKKRDTYAKRQKSVADKEAALEKYKLDQKQRAVRLEKELADMREKGKQDQKGYAQKEAQLAKIREQTPGKIIDKEVQVKKARDRAKEAAANLGEAEKKLAIARDQSSKAAKEAEKTQSQLIGKEGLAAKRKDALRIAVRKLDSAYQVVDASAKKASHSIGDMTARAAAIAGSALKKLSGTVLETSRRMAGALGGAVVNQAKKFADGVKNAMTRASQSIVAASAAVSGASLFKGFERLSAIEESEVKLKTFGINVQQAMDQANKAVKGTAYGLGDAATAVAQLSAANVQLGEDMEQAMGLIGDTAAITGSSFGEISSIYSKIAAAGKLDGGTLDQLQDRGVAVLAALSDASGKTQQEIRKDISDGKVSFQEFADAMEASIGGAAQRSGETVKGSFANLGAALGRLGASMQEETFKKLPTFFGNLTQAIDNAAPAIIQAGKGISGGLTDSMITLSEKILNLSTQVPQMMATIAKNPAFIEVQHAFVSIKDAAGSALPIIASMAGQTIITGFTILGQAAEAVSQSIEVIGHKASLSGDTLKKKYADVLQDVTGFTANAFAAIPRAVDTIAASPVWGTLKGVTGDAVGKMKELAPALVAVGGALGAAAFKVAGAVFQSIGQGLNDANNSARPFADVLSQSVVPWISKMGDTVADLVREYLPPLVTLLAEKLPQAMDTFANDPAFVEARENMASIAEQVIKLVPAFAKIAASGAFVTFTTLNEVVGAIAPVIENILVPALSSMSDFLVKNDWAAKTLGITLGGVFVAGKVLNGVLAVSGAIKKMSTALKIAKVGIQLLFGAMAANPILAIVAAVAALSIGLYHFFRHTEKGRKAWHIFAESFKVTYNKFIKPVLSLIYEQFRGLWKFMGNMIGWAGRKVGSIISGAHTIKDGVGEAISGLRKKITNFVEDIKKKWQSLKDTVTAPFKFGVNAAKGLFGGGKKGKKSGYASGGVLPGYTPGRDVHHYVNMETGHILSLSGGEAIMRPEWVRAQGGSAAINRMNRSASRGRSYIGGNGRYRSAFASGGVVKVPGSKPGDINVHMNNPTIKTKNAKISADKIKESTDKRISHAKTMSDLRAETYALKHDTPVGQAQADLMRAQAEYKEISSRLANSRKLGLGKNEVAELRVQKINANLVKAQRAEAVQKAKVETRLNNAKELSDARIALYSATHKDPVSQARVEAMTKRAELAQIRGQIDNAKSLGLSSHEVKVLKVQELAASAAFQDALIEPTRVAMEKAAEHRKIMSDLNADYYAKRNDGPVGQAVADKMRAEAALVDLQAAQQRAALEGKSAEEMQQFSAQIRNARVDVQQASRQVMVSALEVADNHRKTLADLDADFYAKINNDQIGQAVAERMKAEATLNDLIAQRNRAMIEGKPRETIVEFNRQIRNATKDLELAGKAAVLARMEVNDNHRATMAELRADLYAKSNKSARAQAVAERMRAENQLAALKAERRRAQVEGKPGYMLKEIDARIRIATKDVSNAAKEVRQAANASRADRIKHRGTLRSKRVELFEAQNYNDPVALVQANVKKAANAVQDAIDEISIASLNGASYEERLELQKDLQIARVNYLKEQKEAQRQIAEENLKIFQESHEYLDGYIQAMDALGDSLTSAFDIIDKIGKELNELKKTVLSELGAFISGFTSISSAYTAVTASERTLQRTRVEGVGKIIEANNELQKSAKSTLKLTSTSANALMSSAEGGYALADSVTKLGGSFIVSTKDVMRSQAALAEAQAQAAIENARAEFELKKSRLDATRTVLDQVKATSLLVTSMSEYIAKAKLINGMNERDTDSLAKFYAGVSQRQKGEAMIAAAQQQMQWAKRYGNTAQYQQAVGQLYEGQKLTSLGQYQMDAYRKEANKAYAQLPKDIQQGLQKALQQDQYSTQKALQDALRRQDYATANAVAKNAGMITSAYLDTLSGYRDIQNELISRNAQYEREDTEMAANIGNFMLDLQVNKLQNSFDKSMNALQANLDSAQAWGKAYEAETKHERDLWTSYAKQSQQDYQKSLAESQRYNSRGQDHYTINIEGGQAYTGEQVAQKLAPLQDRLDNVEVQLSGKQVSGSQYFMSR